MTPPLHRHLSLEIKDLHLLPCLALAHEFVSAQGRGNDAQVRPARVVALAGNLGRSKDRVANEHRTSVTAGDVAHVTQSVVSHIRAREARAQVKGNAAVHNLHFTLESEDDLAVL